MPQKIKAAERLKVRALDSEYNKLIKKFSKFSDNNQTSYTALASSLNNHTLEKLKAEGFTISETQLYNEYNALLISW